MKLIFVKTARAVFLQGYVPALATEGMLADDLTTIDGASAPAPSAARA